VSSTHDARMYRIGKGADAGRQNRASGTLRPSSSASPKDGVTIIDLHELTAGTHQIAALRSP
jgi:hypothetical protein